MEIKCENEMQMNKEQKQQEKLDWRMKTGEKGRTKCRGGEEEEI